MYPTYFDKDDLMYCDTYFGDYPHYAPGAQMLLPSSKLEGSFRGWMLLSYKKPVTASSNTDSSLPANAVDESVKTFWVAQKNDDKQWLQIDLVNSAKVFAVQVNYHDYKSNLYGKLPGIYHRYTIEGSVDGNHWIPLVNRQNNFKDVPNDYVEIAAPQTVRFVRYKNIHVPTPNLSIAGLRVFGLGTGKIPGPVKNFKVNRNADRRDAMITWTAQTNVQGYNILWGIAPDKLYNSWMVYDKNSLLLKSLSTDQVYYFSVESFNENGISERSKAIKIE